MLEFLLREALDDAGLADRVEVDSAGISAEESGNPADPRTLAVLRRNAHADWGGSSHRARRIEKSWLADRDLVLAADSGHLRALRRLAGGEPDHVRLIRSFDPAAVAAGTLDVDDPWYGWTDNAFDQTYAELQAAIPGILAHVEAALAER
jgi:protein-tyrosine phosphatase